MTNYKSNNETHDIRNFIAGNYAKEPNKKDKHVNFRESEPWIKFHYLKIFIKIEIIEIIATKTITPFFSKVSLEILSQ